MAGTAVPVDVTNRYRLINLDGLARRASTFPDITRLPVALTAHDWNDVYDRFLADGTIVDTLYQPKGP